MLKEFEGCVPWMYRDTVGKVTVGVGLMLPDVKAAQTLPFLAGSEPATSEQIATEFARVDSMPLGRASTFYKSPTSLQLAHQTIDARLLSILQNFEADLRTEFPHYDTLPDAIKLALLDMIYNLGPAGLFKGFPHLVAAIQTGAWAQAAEHCMRRGPSAARNNWTRNQFLSAVVGTINAEAEGWLTRILSSLRQILSRIFGPSR
jgi:GH24 family phage-related lysozyme (muramidase)